MFNYQMEPMYRTINLDYLIISKINFLFLILIHLHGHTISSEPKFF
jgi:hypothetical protein